jgi:hypothetical protein
LLGGALLVVVVLAIVALRSGRSSSTPGPAAAVAASAPTSKQSTTSAGSGSSTAAKVVAHIKLTPPGSGSKATGIAEILKDGANTGLAIVAQGVAPNTTHPSNVYAVWLYNTPTDARLLGFVEPLVKHNRRLSTAGGLPSNASHYKQLIITLQTHITKTPGKIILHGTLLGL